jgi:hypothetical protein
VGAVNPAKRILVPLLAGVLGLTFAGAGGAATINVNCTTQNLQNKINAAPAGSTLLVKGTCTGTFTITKRLTVVGNPNATLDANDLGSVLSVTASAPVRLVRLRIMDGTAPTGGGISATAGGTLTLEHVTISGNKAGTEGGGIASLRRLVLRHSSVLGNLAEFHAGSATVRGGGILAPSVQLTDSIVRNNTAHAIGDTNPTKAFGGGIQLDGGGLVAVRSHIDRNTARADGPSAIGAGGGVAQQFGTVVRLTDSTVNRNAAIGDAIVGNGHGQGGAVLSQRLVATRTDFLGNRASGFSDGGADAWGGALYVVGEQATLTRVRVKDSRLTATAGVQATTLGGGMYVESPSSALTVTGSTISGNEIAATGGISLGETQGGGIEAAGSASILRSTISANAARATSTGQDAVAGGGGIRARGPLQVKSSTVSGNIVRGTSTASGSEAFATGGGISVEAPTGTSVILNSTITLNSARGFTSLTPGALANVDGGGINASATGLRMTNVTVARNSVGGAAMIMSIRGGGVVVNSATVELRGSVLAGNTAPDGPDCGGPVTSLGYNLVASTAGCTFTAHGTDKQNRPAKLGTFGLHGGPTKTIPLLRSSPALNAIPKSACAVPRDQRGVKRPKQRRCEMGAYERKP